MMHTVPTANGLRRKDVPIKVLRCIAYGLMGGAGVLLMFSPALRHDLGPVGFLMAIFLAVGGFVSGAGALTERWVGEYVGIPLLSASFAVFGIISTVAAIESAPLIATANLSLLLAVSAGLLARWREARAVYRLATHLSRKKVE
jgi:hypothetical protein